MSQGPARVEAFTGAHFPLYSKDPQADRAFLRDALDLHR